MYPCISLDSLDTSVNIHFLVVSGTLCNTLIAKLLIILAICDLISIQFISALSIASAVVIHFSNANAYASFNSWVYEFHQLNKLFSISPDDVIVTTLAVPQVLSYRLGEKSQFGHTSLAKKVDHHQPPQPLDCTLYAANVEAAQVYMVALPQTTAIASHAYVGVATHDKQVAVGSVVNQSKVNHIP